MPNSGLVRERLVSLLCNEIMVDTKLYPQPLKEFFNPMDLQILHFHFGIRK